jgi:hypothetical protein
MENQPWGNPSPWQSQPVQPFQPRPEVTYPIEKRELLFGAASLLFAYLLCNCLFFAGANLGLAVATIGCILCSVFYLSSRGCRLDGYSGTLLLLSLLTAAGFARSDDGFVKFVCTCFLLLSGNLTFCLMAGQNRRARGSVRSLLDAPRAVFALGFGKMPETFRGLGVAFRRSGSVGQKGGAFLLGVCITVPVVAIMLPLLSSADAAFAGLVALLPEFEGGEWFTTLLFGTMFGCVSFVRGVALRNAPKAEPTKKTGRGIHAVTVNTVLCAVSLLYGVYLLSQLAYFSGGFARILPEGYTLAQYARRGFFEMAVLSGGNLLLMVLSLGLVKKDTRAPLSTRLMSLFIGLVTLFLIAAASAKMFLYIDSFGLTRQRLLTQIIMLFLALTTVVVSIWLFVPKLPYMQLVLVTALVISAATLWADVDTQVARYNVDAYLSGRLETVDVQYLRYLGNGAVPQLARLEKDAPNGKIKSQANTFLKEKARQLPDSDIRKWNYVNHMAKDYLPKTDS